MKKTFFSLILFSVFVFIPSSVFAADGDVIWSNNWDPNTNSIGFFGTQTAGIPNDVYTDATGAYFVGGGSPGAGFFVGQWGIQKRDLSTGALIWQDIEKPSGVYSAYNRVSITGDGAGSIFVAGAVLYNTSAAGTWVTQKIDANTGNIIWSAISSPTQYSLNPVAKIAYQGSSLYIAGQYATFSSYVSKLEKRSAVDGSLIWDQEYNTYPCQWSGGIYAMKVTSSAIYLAETRETCAMDPSFALPWGVKKLNLNGGVIWSQAQPVDGTYYYVPNTIELDGSNLYIGGFKGSCWNGAGNVDSYLEMRNESSGGFVSSDIPVVGSCNLGAINSVSGLASFAGNLYVVQTGSGGFTVEKRSTINSIVWSKFIAPQAWWFGSQIVSYDDGTAPALFIGAAQDFGANNYGWLMEKRGITSNVPTVTFSASPLAVNSGSQASLTWGSTNATSCTAGGPWSNSGTLSGSGLTNPLTTTTTFTFQCTGPGGTSPLQSQTVTINPPPSVTLSASPSTIYSGQSTKLTWTSSGAASCNFPSGSSLYTPGGYPANNTSGLSTGPLTSSQSYQISCTGPSGTGNSNIVPVTVLVPTATISASPARIPPGGSTTITWSGTNVSSCTITKNGVVWKTLSGASLTGSAPDTKITVQNAYLMTCTNGVTSPVTTAQTIVNIAPNYREF
ncbi:MAG: DUF5585 domain-containing protein [Minisyncoccota bacterium]